MVPVDAAARDAALARGEDAERAWLAGVAGGELRERVVTATAGNMESPMSVPHVAAAVDNGRELAARAARDGVTVLVGRGTGSPRAQAVADWLAGRHEDPEIRGPLGALRRLGDGELCVLCGLALGAGEQGLGYVCDDLAARAAAGIAIAVEPSLAPRVRGALLPA